MLVKRDLFTTIQSTQSLEALLLWGPRQVGKTTLLSLLPLKSQLFLDDLSLRKRAQQDPAFALDIELPCLIDEIQYAPNLFPEIKLRIDRLRREQLSGGRAPLRTQYFLTGSNRTLLDKSVKESLAGRCSLYTLHGLSAREILAHFPEMSVKTLMMRGGFPDLYTRSEISPQRYLNDYIQSFIEKDIAFSAGIEKQGEFQTLLQLLAARTGQFLNVNEISAAAGVDNKTIKTWIDLLQRNLIVELVAPYYSNLSKRITKMKKLYFYDVGLCARLQGHVDEQLLWNSPQSGSLFETLVFSEIAKTRANFSKDWKLYTWRTKEQAEVDFILSSPKKNLFIEAKLGIHGARAYELDKEAYKVFDPPHRKVVVTVGGSLWH